MSLGLEVFFAYAIVTRASATLFINDAQLDESARTQIRGLASVRPYEEIFSHAKSLSVANSGSEQVCGARTYSD